MKLCEFDNKKLTVYHCQAQLIKINYLQVYLKVVKPKYWDQDLFFLLTLLLIINYLILYYHVK